MPSFGSATFSEKGDNAVYFPRFGTRALNTYRRPPGGTRIVKQTSGQKEQTLSLQVQCTAAELAALEALVDTEATLTWSGGTRYATLDAIVDPQKIGAYDLYVAGMELTGR